MSDQQASNAKAQLWSTLMAGPIAGLCSRCVVYPADTIKARLQVQGSALSTRAYASTFDAIIQIARQEGFGGFYKGFTAVVVGAVPGNIAYFGGYELGKAAVPGGYGLLTDMGVGAFAQLVGGVVFTPMDIIKERMQVQSVMRGSPAFNGPLEALRILIQNRGMLGLFKGYWATNAVWLPWSTLYIGFYEQSKRAAVGLGYGPAPDQLPPFLLGISSAGCASFAALLTHPADVVKTRLQVMSGTTAGTDATALDIARDMHSREGPRVRQMGHRSAFLRGAAARILTLAPGTALSWMIYEPVTRLLGGNLSA